MKVLVDVSTLGLGMLHPEWRGGGFRADERILELLHASRECELTFCANHSSVTWDAAQQYVRSHPALANVPLLGGTGGGRRTVARRFLRSGYRLARRVFPAGPLPRVVRSGGEFLEGSIHREVVDTPEGADVFHSTHFPLPPRPRGRSPQRFLTIYDLRYRHFPELYDKRSIEVGEAILRSVGPDDWVITSSNASRDDLAGSGVARPEQIFVVPLAADPDRFHPCHDAGAIQRVRSRYGIGPGPYILSLNSIDVRKNMQQAVRAFSELSRRKRIGDAVFVIAGAAGSGSSQMAAALAEATDVRHRILQIGFVDEADLAPLYAGASAFVYPSLFEGFGLPPLEAMQCGTPVVTSNSSSLPEVVGEAGLMVPPDDLDALCTAIEAIVVNGGMRDELASKAIARAKEFSWERSAASVLAAYRSALAQHA